MKHSVTIASLLTSFAAASPLTMTKTLDGRDITVTAADVDNFREFAQWSSAAYCNVGLSEGSTLSCGPDSCPEVEASGATIHTSLSGRVTGIAGFVAVDSTNKQVVVSIRGTSNIANWITNILFFLESCDLVSGCKVHDGFSDAWVEIENDTVAAVRSALAANPTFPLVVTGHSLGGAVATIAAAYLRKAGFPCDLYTYGSPRVGNDDFAVFVSEQAGTEYRVTSLDDPVPRLPPLLFGYRHTDEEFWLSDESDPSVITTCEGIRNVDCNASEGGLDVAAHGFYFVEIGTCDGDSAKMLVKDSFDFSGISDEAKARIAQWAEWDVAAMKADAAGQVNAPFS